MELKIRPEYAGLYGIDVSLMPMPKVGESIRDYVKRSGLGKEEDILPVVNGSWFVAGSALRHTATLTLAGALLEIRGDGQGTDCTVAQDLSLIHI